LLKRIKFKLVSFFKVYRIKKEHDIIVVETKDAKQKLIDLFSFKYSNIVVIGNTFNNVFNDANKLNNKYYSVENKKFYLLTVSANYPHKNLEIIKKIVPYLKFYKIKIHFFVTLQQIDFQELFFDLEEYVTNLGPLEVADLPDAYLRCNAVFMPSLLETFSATYPEAMKMEKPILTSDLSFARDICGPAAEYFDPLNPEDILQKIINLINNKDRQLELIRFGKERLKTFETSESRARKYLELCEKLVNEKL
jgi:glycosyltransferase involved in cell wall biosynthesis